MLTQYAFNPKLNAKSMHGRRRIYTNVLEITAENVVSVVTDSLGVFRQNCLEANYLWSVYCGAQDVQFRQKKTRKEIRNVVTINEANKIVTFKTAYLLADPIQYVSTDEDEISSNGVRQLNECMRLLHKKSLDKDLADMIHITGFAYRLVVSNPNYTGEDWDVPGFVYNVDPTEGFCVYHSGISHRKMLGVIVEKDEDGKDVYVAYTADRCYRIKDSVVINSDEIDGGYGEYHSYGSIPVVEYNNNIARLGAFEVVLEALNAVNELQSCRLDDVENFVNSLLIFYNCEISEEQAKELVENLGLQVTSTPDNPAKIDQIQGQLDQTGVQAIVDDIKSEIRSICGIPAQNDSGSTSDNVGAVIYRSGWSDADSRAKDSEDEWEAPEAEVIDLYCRIINDLTEMNIDSTKIDIRFPRHNLTDMQSKVQAFIQLVNCSYVDPKDAYDYVGTGMFVDVQEAYKRGMARAEKEKTEELEAYKASIQTEEPEEDSDTEEEIDDGEEEDR